MAKGSDNPFPSVLLDEQGAAPTTPASGFWRLYAKSDGLYLVDDAGAETGPLAASAGTLTVETIRTKMTTNLTTTSTTLTPMDSTNLGYTQHQHTLDVGDVVEMVLTGQFYISTGTIYIHTDIEIDQPTSADIFLSAATSSGTGTTMHLYDVNRRVVSFVYTFVATEAGLHKFRPVWKVGSGTGTLDNSSTPLYFTSKKLTQ